MMPAIGSMISFLYPRHNYHCTPQTLERRRIRVDRVRDMRAEPPDILAIALNPMLRRGLMMITGLDLDKGLERSFYWESMQDVQPFDPPAASGEIDVAIVERDGLQLQDTWSAETVDEAATFADEFNRLEHHNPKGQVAFVDRFGLCTKTAPRAA